VGKPEGKRPLGNPRLRWDDHIKSYILVVGCGDMGWIDLDRDRDRWRALVNAVMNLRASLNAGNFLVSLEHVAFQEWLCSME
jgi:hypothetical protein